MKRLLLVGGGHAQLAVLHDLARKPVRELDVVLISRNTHSIYSGMLPGWMAGHYPLEACHIDLRPLASAAGVRLVVDEISGMDARRHCVVLSDGKTAPYDFLSLDVGSETSSSWLALLGDRLLTVRPIEGFVQRWTRILEQARLAAAYHLVVVGAGAAGVELALAAQHALAPLGGDVTLVAAREGILPGHAAAVVANVQAVLQTRGVQVCRGQAVGCAEGVLLDNGQILQSDVVIAATGASAPVWLQLSHLDLDDAGFIAVDRFQRSVSHPEVFAAGDVCSRSDVKLARSGVHAVRAGPVLAHNLVASVQGRMLKPFRPRARSLYLLATGPRHAIASWGRFTAQGEWVWQWKDGIDRRFMRQQGTHNSRAVGALRESGS
ncbi:MAG: FAD-dependent oxidoreductase [Pseudomonadales bacterium]|nr:FAD-dependent oxidoreductase [Pseudomonadales bacterium]